MSIFNFFNNKNRESQLLQTEQKDERKSECPYCHKALKKVPGSKTKCPHCSEFIFVRTQPKGNVRVVVTKDEADRIDEEWSIVAGTHDNFIAEKEEIIKEKEILEKRFDGKEPSENDVKWGLLNKQLLEHAKNGNWGLYRNTKFQMAEILRRELKLKHALRTYLEICYLDLNGPNNIGGFDDPEFLEVFLPFDPSEGNSFLAPGIIDSIQKIIKKLEITKEELQKDFIEHNSRIEKSMNLPVPPVECWERVETEL